MFSTDGCSGGLSVGWEYLADTVQRIQTMHGTQPPWQSCCIRHDRANHQGGSNENTAGQSFAVRKQADLELKACVLETGMKRIPELSAEYNISDREVELIYTAIADLMYRAVRVSAACPVPNYPGAGDTAGLGVNKKMPSTKDSRPPQK